MILIENYRGYEISFDANKETFCCTFDERYCEKQTFRACKTAIDAFLKANSTFKPFTARNEYDGTLLQITGLRNDGDFQANNGERKFRLTSYHARNYLTIVESDDAIFQQIANKQAEKERLQQEIEDLRNTLQGTRLDRLPR